MPTDPPGISWQNARAAAVAHLDKWESDLRAQGKSPESLKDQAGPLVCFADQQALDLVNPDFAGSLADHAVIVRAIVKEARSRWSFRVVPLEIEAAPFREWLHGKEPTASAAFTYALTCFLERQISL